MKTRRLGDHLEVSTIGLGCMGLSTNYGTTPDREEAISFLRTVFERGEKFFDTAEAYGPFTNEDPVGEALAPFRDEVVISTKFGFDISETGERVGGLNSKPDHIRAVCEASLKRLRAPRNRLRTGT